jgi:dipeptidase
VGASSWSYFVPYQADLNTALEALRQQVLTDGDYWWARGEFGKSASAYDNRPSSIRDLFDDEWVQESGTHSILDMHHVLADGEAADYGTVQPVTTAEAQQYAGTERLTRDHIGALDDVPLRRWFGRCAVLHDTAGQPDEIYFWGYSGD